ncbi:glycoside hydrolase family 43 protein [Glycomyces buryatensis]|uniref:Glycoside hydrolase family 43 protein n=1 Tax=Glycomyces buryatensis TaxID=2570927 RepID=A0A4S8Q6R1_9ACTN|nr:glycoside hydrolase family 43 protein [Glycomyces buryatensis]THV36449.1 glycoside hydrolase family 43 protein [Glycomyces buryatensis]
MRPIETAATTPVIAGCFPDPSVCRVGEDYYLANSSMEYAPAVPIWHSRDLVSWRQIGNALDRDVQFPAGRSTASRGVYAPTLRHHEGRFWLVTTDIDDPRGGHLLFSATDAAGPWSDPVHLAGIDGIDPDLTWDDEGTCLLTYCSWNDKQIGIRQVAIDPDTGKVLEEPRWIWHGTGLGNPEGPHLYRRGEWWHLVIAEGGTDRGHVVSVARSRSPRGPFESAPHNPVFTHRSTRHPVQNVGHADLVERPDGTWATVHLGVRPRGRTPRYHVNGRETFLAEIAWIDDWPQFTPSEAALPESRWSFKDEFTAPRLDPRWVSPGVRPEQCASLVPGGVRVEPAAGTSGEPSGLFFRTAGNRWEADITVEPGESAFTAAVRIDRRHWYGLRMKDHAAEAVSRVGEVEAVVGARPLSAAEVTFRIRSVEATKEGPDDIELGIVDDSGFSALARLDGRYVSTEVAGGFTGRTLGLWAEAGSVLVRKVEFVELPEG